MKKENKQCSHAIAEFIEYCFEYEIYKCLLCDETICKITHRRHLEGFQIEHNAKDNEMVKDVLFRSYSLTIEGEYETYIGCIEGYTHTFIGSVTRVKKKDYTNL